jgi:hypothetical protein
MGRHIASLATCIKPIATSATVIAGFVNPPGWFLRKLFIYNPNIKGRTLRSVS